MEFTKEINFSGNLKENEIVKITYSGELFKNNSEEVTIVYGFGENWDYTSEKNMEKTESGFTANIEIKENYNKFNFCFRNSNYIWDNNNNCNYISSIEPATTTENIVETDTLEEIDEASLIEFLDNLLEENNKTIVEENVTSDDKQQILDELLLETTVKEPILAEEFDMNNLIENILNPVINFEVSQENQEFEEDDFESIETAPLNNETDNALLIEELEREFDRLFGETETAETNAETDKALLIEELEKEFDRLFGKTETTETEPKEEQGSNVSLVATKSEENYLVSPRQLSRFYLIKKKIKLALYKLFVAIPKILTGEFNNSQD